jgi:hypothetical protein
MSLSWVGRVAVVAWVLAACGAAVPPLPSKGGPAWVELTSEHFTVWTDAEPDRARELIREMERMRQIILGMAFPSAPAAGKIPVIVLRDDAELAELSVTGEPRAYAATGEDGPLWRPMLVLSAFSNRDPADHTVVHELTHAISFAVVHHQPRWLSEGTAEFFETVDPDPTRTTADIGVPPQYRGQPIKMPHLIPIEKLFAWGRLSKGEQREYSTAWALFTFLINEHRTELVHFLQLLNADSPTTPRKDRTIRAWNAAFPTLPLDSIDTVLGQWLLTGHHVVVHVNVQLRDWPATERRLGDGDVLAIRALLRSRRNGAGAQLKAEVDAALAADRTNVLAWSLRVAVLREPISAEDARALTAAHPEDWLAWLFAAVANENSDAEALATARTKACLLIAENPAITAPAGLCESAPPPPAP